MNTVSENKLRVLSLLCDNLKNPHPQVVRTEQIAAALKMNLGETRQLLLRMDELGIIKSDMDCHYSLITPQGLSLVSGRRGAAL